MAQQVMLSPELSRYVRENSLRDDEILRDLRETTAQLPGGTAMQVTAEQGQFLGVLVAATGAREVLEIGTFTGYSTLCMARALPAGGRVTTCDITDRWPEIGAAFWRRADVAQRIGVLVGDATETLDELVRQRPESFDFVFLDADKTRYVLYYELALRLLRRGGLLVIDNTLFSGRVADPLHRGPETDAIRDLNKTLLHDDRVDVSLLPVADGVTLVHKR